MFTFIDSFRKAIASVALLVIGFGPVACTSERPSDKARSAPTAAPSATADSRGGFSLALRPAEANRKTVLTLIPAGFSIQNASVTWYVDGSPVQSSEPDRFVCSGIARGSSVHAGAIVQGQEVKSNDVTIRNTPPELSEVALQPAMTGQEETLEVSANANDADNDPVTIQYVWTVNDVPAGNGPKLIHPLKRGDSVRVEVTPNDGLASGERVVVNQTIADHAPVFIEHQDFNYSGNTFIYEAQATDVDGDRITYGVEGAVEGMVIDPNSGRLTWSAPPGFRGDQPVTIFADDGHGGVARYTVTFRLR